MKIILSGYNIEKELANHPLEKNQILTPETFSAAYARISRSTKDVDELRKHARNDIVKSRKSNKTIIFEMGHHSVAEHAVFNFELINISRLALEELERFRLVSYTEKSQRYVTLKGDYLLPVEITKPQMQQRFMDTVNLQNSFYAKAYRVLKEYIFRVNPKLAEDKSNRRLLEGWAKEDARYILSLATLGQVGLTANARNLEHMFRRFSLSQREEIRKMGQIMFGQVMEVAPSIFLFPRASEFEKAMQSVFVDQGSLNIPGTVPESDVKLIGYTRNGDDIILASFISIKNSIDYDAAYQYVKGLGESTKEDLFHTFFEQLEFFDSPGREFEFPSITVQALISASNFAQLKRHRLATLTYGDYNIELGNTIPQNIIINGLENEFLDIIEKTNQLYLQLSDEGNPAADYILTNSHRRMVLMKMNLREMYHFIRLRDDEHAQWDIRTLAKNILTKVKAVFPYSTRLLCGKSDFNKTFKKIYNKSPKFNI